jgi:hypothetical protein
MVSPPNGMTVASSTVSSMPGIFAASASGPMMRRPKRCLQRQIGFDMVGMVVGGQNHRRLPAGALDRREDRPFLRRVDQGGLAAFGSCTSTPKLSLRHMNWSISTGMPWSPEPRFAENRAAGRRCHPAARPC